MTSPPNILVVCQAGAGIGLGHLMRSVVAARALRDQLAARVELWIHGDEVDAGYYTGMPHQHLATETDLLHALSQRIAAGTIDILLLDLFPSQIQAELGGALSAWRGAGCKVVAIDGLQHYRDRLDLIFLPSFLSPKLDGVSNGAPVVYGWDCFLLNVCDNPPAWAPGDNVLVLTGGSDISGLGRVWPAYLDQQLPPRSKLHWVTGPYAKSPQIPVTRRLEWHEHVAPNSLGQLMSQVSYAVTLFGVSFFELLYHGVPTVVFSPYDGRDNEALAFVEDAGVALVARDEKEATALLATLMNDLPLATRLSRKARDNLSQPGGRRLCREVSVLLGQNS